MPAPLETNNGFTPSIGDIVVVNEGYVPVGPAVVEEINPDGFLDDDPTVTLRGRNRNGQEQTFSDGLSWWRGYGLRLAESTDPLPPLPEPGQRFTLRASSVAAQEYGMGPHEVQGITTSVLRSNDDIGNRIIRFSTQSPVPTSSPRLSDAYFRYLVNSGYEPVSAELAPPLPGQPFTLTTPLYTCGPFEVDSTERSTAREDWVVRFTCGRHSTHGSTHAAYWSDLTSSYGYHQEDSDMPRVPNGISYEPRIGDRVVLDSQYHPAGTSVVTNITGGPAAHDTRVTLTGTDASQRYPEVTERLSDWRAFGLRLVHRYEPRAGDIVELYEGYVPRGPQRIVQVNDTAVELESLTDLAADHVRFSLRSAFSWGIHLVQGMNPGRYEDIPGEPESQVTPVVGDIITWGTRSVNFRVTGIIGDSGPDIRYSLEPVIPGEGRPRNAGLQFLRDHDLVLIERSPQRDSGPYMPEAGDVVTLNRQATESLNYGRGPWQVQDVRPCDRCRYRSDIPTEDSTMVTLRDGSGRMHEYHLSSWRERGIARAGEAEGREQELPALEIPDGPRYSVDSDRATELAYGYDREFYGSGTYAMRVLHDAQEQARTAPGGRSLLHLQNGLRLLITRLTSYSYAYDLIDTDGWYSENSSLGDGDVYDPDGYNPQGFDADGYNAEGYNADGYDEDGYNEDGYNEAGYDSDGYDSGGYDSDGYDRYGDSRYDDDVPGLHSWDYKPSPVFKAMEDDPQPSTFYGIEIELTSECSRSEMQYIREHGDNERLFYPKSDGSVAGYELNVHPMTWAWASQRFPWSFVEDLAGLGSSVSERENGIHVHVSRDGFSSEAHLFRWMKFIYRNQAHAERIAGRKSDQWAGFREGHQSAQKTHALNQMRARKQREREKRGDHYYPQHRREADLTGESRYSAINTTNSATLEVRIFASTTDASTFRARVGLVAATVEYTRQLTARAIIRGGWDWSAFRTWLLENREVYPDLAALEEAVLAQEEAQEKRDIDAAERRKLKREWLTASEMMSFAEFLSRQESEQEGMNQEA